MDVGRHVNPLVPGQNFILHVHVHVVTPMKSFWKDLPR